MAPLIAGILTAQVAAAAVTLQIVVAFAVSAVGRDKPPSEGGTYWIGASGWVAFGVLLAAQERGIRVPEELSVIGIDDHEFAEPMGLTTLRQSPESQGSYAAELLLGELRGAPRLDTPPYQPHELIIRRSTAPPPSS